MKILGDATNFNVGSPEICDKIYAERLHLPDYHRLSTVREVSNENLPESETISTQQNHPKIVLKDDQQLFIENEQRPSFNFSFRSFVFDKVFSIYFSK